mmetsp:Transcript_25544/g.60925  ORF Transcript_25544/g.60925 Transcript_25544/m.60925 type:complete len:325 (-) Transcript_25544:256-1230(-)
MLPKLQRLDVTIQGAAAALQALDLRAEAVDGAAQGVQTHRGGGLKAIHRLDLGLVVIDLCLDLLDRVLEDADLHGVSGVHQLHGVFQLPHSPGVLLHRQEDLRVLRVELLRGPELGHLHVRALGLLLGGFSHLIGTLQVCQQLAQLRLKALGVLAEAGELLVVLALSCHNLRLLLLDVLLVPVDVGLAVTYRLRQVGLLGADVTAKAMQVIQPALHHGAHVLLNVREACVQPLELCNYARLAAEEVLDLGGGAPKPGLRIFQGVLHLVVVSGQGLVLVADHSHLLLQLLQGAGELLRRLVKGCNHLVMCGDLLSVPCHLSSSAG